MHSRTRGYRQEAIWEKSQKSRAPIWPTRPPLKRLRSCWHRPVVGIAWCAVGRDDVAYGLCGEVVSGGLNVLGMLRLIEHKLIGMFDDVLDLVDVDET